MLSCLFIFFIVETNNFVNKLMRMSDELERIKKKSLLQSYYQNSQIDAASIGTGASSSSLNASNATSSYSAGMAAKEWSQTKDPYDLNSTTFEPDLFLKKLIKVN